MFRKFDTYVRKSTKQLRNRLINQSLKNLFINQSRIFERPIVKDPKWWWTKSHMGLIGIFSLIKDLLFSWLWSTIRFRCNHLFRSIHISTCHLDLKPNVNHMRLHSFKDCQFYSAWSFDTACTCWLALGRRGRSLDQCSTIHQT